VNSYTIKAAVLFIDLFEVILAFVTLIMGAANK
jgi:hypothetical protein